MKTLGTIAWVIVLLIAGHRAAWAECVYTRNGGLLCDVDDVAAAQICDGTGNCAELDSLEAGGPMMWSVKHYKLIIKLQGKPDTDIYSEWHYPTFAHCMDVLRYGRFNCEQCVVVCALE